MDARELRGVGPVLAARLEGVGLGTVEAIDAAPIEDLAGVLGVGSRRAADLKRQSRLVLVPEDTSNAKEPVPRDHADVARAVRRLGRDAPRLAKSKKHARSLKSASKRMSDLVDHLDTTKSRKRLIAEASSIKSDAKRRTGSKRDAKGLRKLADRVEVAVRDIA